MKKVCTSILCVCLSLGASAQKALHFDANAGVKSSLELYDGTKVAYTAYERLFYVTNVEDSTYQFLNVTYTRKSCHFRSQKESDNEAQDKNRARV